MDYIPFSFEFPIKALPVLKSIEFNHDNEWRQWADSLDLGKIHSIASNLTASLVQKKTAESAIGFATLIRQGLYGLHYLVLKQCPSASGMLVLVLREAIERLNHPDQSNSESLKKVASSEIYWPVLYSPNKFLSADLKKIEGRLEIGKDYFLKMKGEGIKKQKKSINFDVPINKLVLRMIDTLRANRHRGSRDNSNLPAWVSRCKELKPLSRDNAKIWRDVGWAAICEAYGDHPEKDPILRQIGQARATRHPGTEKSQLRVIRSHIKYKILVELRKMARFDNPWHPPGDVTRILPVKKSQTQP